jgi:hypothetical protein
LTDTAGECRRKFVDDVLRSMLRSAFAGINSGRSGGGLSSCSTCWTEAASCEGERGFSSGEWSCSRVGFEVVSIAGPLFFRRLDAATRFRGGEAGWKGGMSGGGGAVDRLASTLAASRPSLLEPKQTSDGDMLRASRSWSDDSRAFVDLAGAGFSSEESLKAMTSSGRVAKNERYSRQSIYHRPCARGW